MQLRYGTVHRLYCIELHCVPSFDLTCWKCIDTMDGERVKFCMKDVAVGFSHNENELGWNGLVGAQRVNKSLV